MLVFTYFLMYFHAYALLVLKVIMAMRRNIQDGAMTQTLQTLQSSKCGMTF